VTEHVAAVVPLQVPPVQMYELTDGLQFAVRVELPPKATELGEAVTVQTGRVVTVTVAVARAPVPSPFAPATV
jgi:hypothetical protein